MYRVGRIGVTEGSDGIGGRGRVDLMGIGLIRAACLDGCGLIGPGMIGL